MYRPETTPSGEQSNKAKVSFTGPMRQMDATSEAAPAYTDVGTYAPIASPLSWVVCCPTTNPSSSTYPYPPRSVRNTASCSAPLVTMQ